MKKKSLIVIFSCVVSLAFGQTVAEKAVEKYEARFTTSPREYAFMQVNDRLHYSGGVINFTVDVFSDDFLPSELSKIVYLEMIHEDDLFHEKFAYALNQGRVQKSIDLPIDIPTGNYQLIAYTNYMQNFDFEKCSYRLPLYIQNTLEEPLQVVDRVGNEVQKVPTFVSDYALSVQRQNDNYFVEITRSHNDEPQDFYLISEGLNQVQFVARVKIQGNQKLVKIPEGNLWGSFQKLILVDDDLNVLYAVGFLRPAIGWSSASSQDIEAARRLSARSNERLHAKLLPANSDLQGSTDGFFQRVSELYFGIPRDLQKDGAFNVDAYNKFLARNAAFTWKQWLDRWEYSSDTVQLLPEEGIRIDGRINASEEVIKKSIVVANFFKNRVDILTPVRSDGRFTVEVGIPITSDLVYLSVIDEEKRSLGDKLSIVVDSGVNLQYNSGDQTYFNRSLTDSLIKQQMEFNYAISTFSDLTRATGYFWKDLPYDRELLISDYRSLTNFEDFVREAIPSTSIAMTKGKKHIQMFDHVDLNMANPSMIVLNNTVLKSDSLLFTLPLQSIKSIRLVQDEVTLRKFASALSGGIFIVETRENVSINPGEENPSCVLLTGYAKSSNSSNEIAERFQTSDVFYVAERNNTSVSIPQKGKWSLVIERLGSSGDFLKQKVLLSSENN